MIIEDDLTSGNALRSIFMRKGCQVEMATTVKEGLRHLTQRHDYVILDLMLPDGNGVEVLRRMRDLCHDSKIIITTAQSNPAKLREVQSLQPHRILRKPIDLVDLLGAIGMM